MWSGLRPLEMAYRFMGTLLEFFLNFYYILSLAWLRRAQRFGVSLDGGQHDILGEELGQDICVR